MLASVAWLRELCPFRETPSEAAAALTARGLTVDALREERGDAVLEIDVPANRPDCLGHLGIARELGAAFGVALVQRPGAPAGQGDPIERRLQVAIDDQELCGRYTARLVRGVKVGPSSAALAARLLACGHHSINNVVDASNLVLLETGHPIHAFDSSRIDLSTIRVRRARSGEKLVTLDGVLRPLDPDMLVIADAQKPIALAGVMGGKDSEIQDSTRDVLVEAAWFLPRSVRSTARRLGMATDASYRFERGADPEGAARAQELAVRLLAEMAGGTPLPGMVDAYPGRATPRRLRLRCARVRLLLGYDPGGTAIVGALAALGLSPSPVADEAIDIVVPSYRVDLEREADLVEEVARHLGYDRIPATFPAMTTAPVAPDPRHDEEERCRDFLAQQGFHEAFCYSMLGAGEDDPFLPEPSSTPAAIALDNPIAEPMAYLRRSLLPGLLRAADQNLRRGTGDVRLFEVGRIFVASQARTLPQEPLRVGIAWCGAARPRHFSAPAPEVGLYPIVGMIEALIEAVRPGAVLKSSPVRFPGLHPGRTAVWSDPAAPHGEPIAWCGALHPDLGRKLALDADVFLAEVDLDRLRGIAAREALFAPIPKVPSVTRDLSLVVAGARAFADVREALRRVPSPAPATFDLVDRYAGPPLRPGEVSWTVRVILQPLERTLTDGETEGYRAALVEMLGRDLGIRLRE